MLSKSNIDTLEREGIPFIVGARIRNESEKTQVKILQQCAHLENGHSTVIEKGNGHRLIVSYSDKRASKDAHNRKRGLSKLRKQIASGRLTKGQLNNRGYNKFLKLST